MRSRKGSHRIVVGNVEYRWQARGDDGFIAIGIWPVNDVGPYLGGSLQYHESWVKQGEGVSSSAGDQIIVTNRIVRQIIEHAICKHGYNPLVKADDLKLFQLDDVVNWQSAVRAIVATRDSVAPPINVNLPGSRPAPISRPRVRVLREPVRKVSFKLRADGFPVGRLLDLLKAFKATRSRRGTWYRTAGKGFTIWISDVALFDSSAAPPIWEIRVETLTMLNRAGEECWRELCQGIESFIRNCGLDLVDRSPPGCTPA